MLAIRKILDASVTVNFGFTAFLVFIAGLFAVSLGATCLLIAFLG